MLSSLLKNNPRAVVILSALGVVNIVVWLLAWGMFHNQTALMATCLLAWCYGLRHAVDADHIAAIDNVTRKMMQEGKMPLGVGAWFSLGHSSIVILASLALAATAAALQDDMAWFHEIGGVIGTSVSAGFLLLMALVNLVILRGVWQRFQQFKQGGGILGQTGRGTHYRRDGMVIPRHVSDGEQKLAYVSGRFVVWFRI
ncbi:hypothetical protein OS42_32700 [Dickeya oryzae]